MTEEVYIGMPDDLAEEFVRQLGLAGKPACWRLRRALYGTKQAATCGGRSSTRP